MSKTNQNFTDNMENPVLASLYSFIGHTEIKRLMNQIYTSQRASFFKTVAVLSESAGEGKSFFTAALALAYSNMMRSKVLVINTVPDSPVGDLLLKSVVGVHSEANGTDKIARVDLITARNDVNKQQALGSDFQLTNYIDRFSRGYNIVFIDTCALTKANNCMIDPIIVAKNVDTSILVVSPKSLGHASMRNMVGKLKRYGITPLGAVYNTGVS